MLTKTSERGFSLLEAVIAAGLVTGAFAALAQMLAMSIPSDRSARSNSAAMVLAGQKLEQLRGLTWGFDPAGEPIDDGTTDTAASVEAPAGGTGLRPSPEGTLRANVAGYVDYVDHAGNILGGGDTIPPGTRYVRRWSIERLPEHPDAIVLQVLVTGRGGGQTARLVTLRTRKAP